jgi:Kef-type K+ transport system membrane component KefB
MNVFVVLGCLFLISGLLFCFKPDIILKINAALEKVLFRSASSVEHQKKAGVFFFITSCLMFLFAYLVNKWHLSEFLKRLLS